METVKIKLLLPSEKSCCERLFEDREMSSQIEVSQCSSDDGQNHFHTILIIFLNKNLTKQVKAFHKSSGFIKRLHLVEPIGGIWMGRGGANPECDCVTATWLAAMHCSV